MRWGEERRGGRIGEEYLSNVRRLRRTACPPCSGQADRKGAGGLGDGWGVGGAWSLAALMSAPSRRTCFATLPSAPAPRTPWPSHSRSAASDRPIRPARAPKMGDSKASNDSDQGLKSRNAGRRGQTCVAADPGNRFGLSRAIRVCGESMCAVRTHETARFCARAHIPPSSLSPFAPSITVDIL